MCDGNDKKFLIFNDVHDAVRKAHERLRSHVVVNYRRDIRIPLDCSRCGVDVGEEAVTQTQGFPIVVVNRFRELCIGSFVEARLHLRGRPASLANTSSEGTDFAVPAFSC